MILGTDILWVILGLPLSLIFIAIRDYRKYKQQEKGVLNK